MKDESVVITGIGKKVEEGKKPAKIVMLVEKDKINTTDIKE